LPVQKQCYVLLSTITKSVEIQRVLTLLFQINMRFEVPMAVKISIVVLRIGTLYYNIVDGHQRFGSDTFLRNRGNELLDNTTLQPRKRQSTASTKNCRHFEGRQFMSRHAPLVCSREAVCEKIYDVLFELRVK
jgi:hypothetical protein